MNYPFVPNESKKPTPVPAAAKKKRRKSPIPSLREWQALNFELIALTTVRARNRHPDVMEKLQERIKPLEEKKRQGRRNMNAFITYGTHSIAFFIENPQYIPLMKQEIHTRQIARKIAKENGTDILDTDLKNSVLAAHCQERSNLIFSKGNTAEGDNTWSIHYLHVRNSYIETMGRAARAAEYALNLEKTFEDERTRDIIQMAPLPQTAPTPKPPKPSNPTPVSEPPMPKPKNNWNAPRPSEEQVNEMLQNRCDDNVPGMEDAPTMATTPAPKRIACKPAYVQTDFMHILDHQKN